MDPKKVPNTPSMYKLTYNTRHRKEMLSPTRRAAAIHEPRIPQFRMLVLTEAQADYLRKPQDPNLGIVLHQLIAPVEFEVGNIQIKKVVAPGIAGASA